jgi:phosphate transport system substrate-binding protein
VIGRLCRVVAALGVMAAVAVWNPGAARAQDTTPTPVELIGAGTGSVFGVMNQVWKRQLYSSTLGMNLGYFDRGDKGGRTQFASGDVDFAVSALPMSADDTAALAARGASPITAPIAVSAIGFLAGMPHAAGGMQRYAVPDDPEAPLTFEPITGPVLTNVPATSLAQVFLSGGQVRVFSDPSFTSQYLPDLVKDSSSLPVVRTDPSATNFFLEQFLRSVAPDAWTGLATQNGLPATIQLEDWPFANQYARSGEEAVASLIGTANDNAGVSNGHSIFPGGNIGPVSPWAMKEQYDTNADRPDDQKSYLYTIALRNGAGEWVAPTPQSIDAAANAGGGTPLYGLAENVPGAYPLTWISNIIVPDKGLPADKATALATFMRYAAGPGQLQAATLGEGQLPPALVARTMAAADQMLKSNCDAAKGDLVTVDGGGPYWPTGITPPASSTICVVPPGTATTTTTVGDGGGGVAAAGSGFIGGGSSSDATGTSSDAAPTTSGTSGGSAGSTEVASAVTGATPTGRATRPAASTRSVAAELPLGAPDDGRGTLDRLTTMLLGGLAFLVVRAGVRRFGASS